MGDFPVGLFMNKHFDFSDSLSNVLPYVATFFRQRGHLKYSSAHPRSCF